ncbi:histidine kinase [Methylobacterium sp. BTF04]|uniref:cache domain-containing protein n=1 Tax=Methylobacterium sp. BTF04 TaxID=2708300 RepID=UPI0013D7BB0E|nr:cache domain-containing protein [Methylobacterium sp. BTF04]NEU11825.1 histidine kinase [Methylobacterium sp. BTF04]
MSGTPRLVVLIALTALSFLAIAGALPGRALACGFVEAPSDCDEGSEGGGARWMLKRVAAAVAADEPKALQDFTRGEAGFRTADNYVFCVGPTGTMTAHPNPILRDHDVRDLHDETGHYFIADMLRTAKPGEVSEIHYLFPRLGSTKAVPKTTFYTRAGDQVCAVGSYDGDASAHDQTVETSAVQLRDRLDKTLPVALRPTWNAYLEAVAHEAAERDATMDRLRDSVRRTQALLAGTSTGAASPAP